MAKLRRYVSFLICAVLSMFPLVIKATTSNELQQQQQQQQHKQREMAEVCHDLSTAQLRALSSVPEVGKENFPISVSDERPSRRVAWSVDEFPNPGLDKSQCRTSTGRVCDPDVILSHSDIEEIESAIANFERDSESAPLCLHSSTKSDVTTDGIPNTGVQMVVAIMRQLDISEISNIDAATEHFARGIHNKWGVGSKYCGGTGVLIFFSIFDRTIYISIGEGVDKILTKKRLDKVIEIMKPHLQHEAYGSAILSAVASMNWMMKNGPPSYREKIWDRLGPFTIIFAYIAGVFIFKRRSNRIQRQYAEVESQLSRLDRDRAQALMGRYECTSCPICLEDFQSERPSQTTPGSEVDTTSISSSDEPLLDDEVTNNNIIGSDGLPVKLLRCGHAFDETCWKDWVASGQGDVRKCPICKEYVGTFNTTTTTSENAAVVPRHNEIGRDAQTLENRVEAYERERNFRLTRAMNRYPRFVTRSLVDRWTSQGYNGNLSQDRDFVRSNPRTPESSSGSRGSGGNGYGGFGGGTSAGGRGGRW